MKQCSICKKWFKSLGYARHMAMHRDEKKIEKKYCEYCGKELQRKIHGVNTPEQLNVFLKRRFCGNHCAGMGKRKPDAGDGSIMERARKYRKKSCEHCRSTKNLTVHHIDKNRLNNSPDNLLTLCKSCHAKLHWRNGDQRKRVEKMKTQGVPCLICGEPSVSFELCEMHYTRFKTHGNPFLVKVKGPRKTWVLTEEIKDISSKTERAKILNYVKLRSEKHTLCL